MGTYDGVLVQVTDIYSAADDSNYRRQKVYKNHDFAKAALILATKEAEEAQFDKKTSKEGTKRNNNV